MVFDSRIILIAIFKLLWPIIFNSAVRYSHSCPHVIKITKIIFFLILDIAITISISINNDIHSIAASAVIIVSVTVIVNATMKWNEIIWAQ